MIETRNESSRIQVDNHKNREPDGQMIDSHESSPFQLDRDMNG